MGLFTEYVLVLAAKALQEKAVEKKKENDIKDEYEKHNEKVLIHEVFIKHYEDDSTKIRQVVDQNDNVLFEICKLKNGREFKLYNQDKVEIAHIISNSSSSARVMQNKKTIGEIRNADGFKFEYIVTWKSWKIKYNLNGSMYSFYNSDTYIGKVTRFILSGNDYTIYLNNFDYISDVIICMLGVDAISVYPSENTSDDIGWSFKGKYERGKKTTQKKKTSFRDFLEKNYNACGDFYDYNYPDDD